MKEPRFLFFGGKGGVGKTTCAAAAAVRRAERGERILVLSTDPAHSLGDALGTRLSSRARRVPVRKGQLRALELDADAALERWLGPRQPILRAIAERGTYLDRDDLDTLTRLSMPGVDELIGLVELARLARASQAEQVVVDTAPTGHTLRLLETPELLRRIAEVLDDMQAKHRLLSESLARSYRRDRADALIDELADESESLRNLVRDPERTAFHWVTLAEEVTVAESLAALKTLRGWGVPVVEIVANRLTPPPDRRCGFCSARRKEEARALKPLRRLGLPLAEIGALEREPRGVPLLRKVGA